MKDDHSSDGVQQQTSEQGPTIPSVDELSIPERQYPDGKAKQNGDVSRLEQGVERTNRLMVLLTAVMSVATLGGAIIAYCQWATAKSQFREDQRPYVISKAEPMPMIPGHRIEVKFRNGNYGKSPAIRSGGVGKVFFGLDALQQAERWMKEEAPNLILLRYQTILAPNTPASNVEARDTAVISDRPISAVELQVFLNTTNAIVAVMRQMYSDTNGREYWTDTCVTNLVTDSGQVRILDCNTINRIE
jgi:hypothetical protein